MATKRERIEKLVLDVVAILDNDKKANIQRYTNMFKMMTDDEFYKWASTMGQELDDTIQIFQLPFEEMKMTQIKKAAERLNLPLEEYIWFRHNDPEGVRTKTKVPVGLTY